MLGGLDYHSIAVAVKRALTALGQLVTAVVLAPSTMGFSMVNGTLVASQNGTVLTVAIKTLAGNDPSASDPVYVLFRNATSGTGDYTVITLTGANSISTTVGGTFGVANAVPFQLWIVGFNDAGTLRLGFVNCLTTVAGAGAGRDVTGLNTVGLGAFGIASSTQIGAGSTLSQTYYTAGAAVASKAYALLAYINWQAGLAAAGTFNVNHSRLELFRAGVPLPGQVIQTQRNDTGLNATGVTVIPNDNTIPQITEGDQYMTQAITPTSAANVLQISASAQISNDAAGTNSLVAALFQDATANALRTGRTTQAAANIQLPIRVEAKILSAGTAATTFRVRAGSGAAGNTNFNPAVFAGTLNSFMDVQELMA